MAGNRQAATETLLSWLRQISPNNTDIPRYEAFLSQMSDKAFAVYMDELKSGTKYLTLTIPNFTKTFHHTLEHGVAVADKMGVELFQRLWFGETEEVPAHLAPIPRLVGLVPVRLASQRLAKKMSIPKSQRVVNSLTGQVTGESKGAGISYPELRVCAAMNLENTMVELMKYRGGDLRGAAAFTASLVRTGRASVKALSYFASGVESTATLKSYLTSCHLKTTL